jgi:prepilin-type N-terminal cleavage/methylation domain-containing protein
MIVASPQPPATSKPTAKERGFTLIELVIVVVILGILAGIAVVAVQGMTGNSVQSACQSDYKSVEVAVESFKAQLGHYPTIGSDGITGANAVSYLRTADTLVTPSIGPWLRDDPTNGSHYQIQVSTDGSGMVQVWAADGSATIPASGPTGTVADCNQTR